MIISSVYGNWIWLSLLGRRTAHWDRNYLCGFVYTEKTPSNWSSETMDSPSELRELAFEHRYKWHQ